MPNPNDPAGGTPALPPKTKKPKANPLADSLRAELKAEQDRHAQTKHALDSRNTEIASLLAQAHALEAKERTAFAALLPMQKVLAKWPDPWPADAAPCQVRDGAALTFGLLRAVKEARP